jgi:hypothetical protein
LNKFNENNKRIDELRKERDKQVDDLINNQKDGIGFLAEFEAMNKLAEESESIRSAKLFISFLILMLECTPILMKIMASYGPYDSILEAEEYTVNLNTQRDISDQNLKTNKELYINERMAALLVTVEEQLMQEAMSNMLNLAKPEIDKAKQAAAREVVENLKKHLDKFAPVIMPKNGAKEV